MAGSARSDSAVDTTSPPMTTVASGRCTSEPAPVAIAAGTKPMDARSAVVRMARNEARAARRTRRAGAPSFSARRFVVSTMPVHTEMPASAMNPTPAGMLNGRPRSTSARVPPATPKGRPRIVIATQRNRWNMTSSMRAITASETGTSSASRSFARLKFWN